MHLQLSLDGHLSTFVAKDQGRFPISFVFTQEKFAFFTSTFSMYPLRLAHNYVLLVLLDNMLCQYGSEILRKVNG